MRIDANANGTVDWDEFSTYLLLVCPFLLAPTLGGSLSGPLFQVEEHFPQLEAKSHQLQGNGRLVQAT